ncbi:hypothetical protein K1T71_005007 [Dendrolimus kikuchii]|uniref:Uncharacterized protein n=1 Tax=Dendrolimus kikuchii TaxID=765133 RepID=A0ACC1D613_9NEOP|nr:hypothetical protein K1T71_005007 [Dendrolimus kikuchii]
MEEVDSIILHFLRQLNIDIEDSTKSLCELPVETIVKAVSTCLSTINPNLRVPKNLPFGISHRVEVATHIASLCKDLGYKNDVGYQTFLYYNEAELRQVFMFLIERLPNEGKQNETSALPINKKSLLMREIGNKISEDLKTVWIPPCCSTNTATVGDFIKTGASWSNHQILMNEDDMLKQLHKIKDLKESSTQTKAFEEENLSQSIKSKVVRKSKIDKSLKELKETAISLRQKLDVLESEKNVIGVEYSQVQRSCERVQADLKNVQNILSSIGMSSDETEGGAETFLDRVQNNINQFYKKSEDLMSKNLSLKVDIDKVNNVINMSETERNKYKKTLKALKDTAKSMKSEFDKKEIARNQLRENYEKLSNGNKRSIYTKRILEIISNVDKQNTEIQKILEDTRQLQKEINTVEGQLERCFSIADETLFKDAKKDDQAKKAYKLLALLHSECNTIVSLVNDTGSLARDIVDLEENIKTEKAKKTEDNLKKIQDDITKMQQEH